MKHVLVGALALGLAGTAFGAARTLDNYIPWDGIANDVQPGEGMTVNGSGDGVFATAWGTHAGQGTHAFGGVSVYPDPAFPTLFVTVTSGSMPTPPGKKFAGFVQIDFSTFGPGDFPNHFVDIIGIKTPGGSNFINTVSANVGTVSSDGFSIFWTGTGTAVTATPQVRIEWTQAVPAPGAAALLGLGGLAAIRRRR